MSISNPCNVGASRGKDENNNFVVKLIINQIEQLRQQHALLLLLLFLLFLLRAHLLFIFITLQKMCHWFMVFWLFHLEM